MSVKSGSHLFAPADLGGSFGVNAIIFDRAAQQMVSKLHPRGAACPNCSTAIAKQQEDRFYTFEQVRCCRCRTKFTAATGTGLNGSKLCPRGIYLLAVLTWLEVAPARIAGVIECHVDTVHNWQLKFRAHEELSGA